MNAWSLQKNGYVWNAADGCWEKQVPIMRCGNPLSPHHVVDSWAVIRRDHNGKLLRKQKGRR